MGQAHEGEKITARDCSVEGGIHSLLHGGSPGVRSIVRHVHSALQPPLSAQLQQADANITTTPRSRRSPDPRRGKAKGKPDQLSSQHSLACQESHIS